MTTPLLTDVALLARLVAVETVSRRSNAELADFVAEYVATTRPRVWRHVCPESGKVELVLQRGPAGDDGAGLILSGHLDVVPADEPDWASPPFVLTERDGRLLGRGAVDMKGFVALAVNLFRELPDAALAAPLTLILTSDEEVGSLGAQRLVRAWDGALALPKNAIIGEPTGLRVVRMHKGHLKGRIALRGKPAHSGYPQLGRNAIELAGPVIAALTELAATLRDERVATSAHFPDAPFPVLNIGTIAGGSAVNVVPAGCEIHFGLRLLPGQRSDEGWARVTAVLDALPANVREHLEVGITNDSPPMLCDKHAPANIELARLLRQCATVGVSFASDAGTLAKLGIDCVLFGPGRIEDAHQANEFIELSQFVAGRRWLEQIVPRFCSAAGGTAE